MIKYYFYQSYYFALKGLKPSVRHAVRDAMDTYMFEGIEPVFKDSLSSSVWQLLYPTLHKSKVNYANALARSESDSEHPGESLAKPVANSEQTPSDAPSENRGSLAIRLSNRERRKEK